MEQTDTKFIYIWLLGSLFIFLYSAKEYVLYKRPQHPTRETENWKAFGQGHLIYEATETGLALIEF